MIYLFDLDITLWDTFDKHGNPIWAKQLVPPYNFNITDDTVTDDVYAKCTLRKGVREYLEHLRNEGHKIGFISVGAYHGMPISKQPSIHMLSIFDILRYFNDIRVLEYKTFDKSKIISDINEKIVFYDDSPKNLDAVKHLENVIAVDSLNIHDWSKLIGKKYD